MPIENGAEHLAISAGTAYILPSSAPGLSAYGLSVPAQPELLGSYFPQSHPNFVSLQGDYAYVTTGNGLQILYISNPSSPQQVGLWDAGEAPPLVVAVGGSYAYLAGGNELKVIDISDPMNPTRIDTSYAGWSGFIGQDIELSGNLCYTLCGGAIIRAWDISDPLLPLETAVFMLPGPAGGMDLAGNYAYIANENYGLRILDISNPDTLIEAGILHTPDEANDVAIAGNFAYVGCDYDGLRIVDISNPTEPVLRGNLYAPGMYPEFLHVEVIGQHAFVACAWEGLAVVNIANPDYPYLVGTHSALGYSDALAVADNHAFAIEDNFLSIYDCSAAVPVEPETPPVQPASFILHPSHPNPFNASTVLSFQLPVPSWVKLEVFDINGRLVGAHRSAPMSGSETTPTTEFFPAGTRRITFNGSDLPSGIYLARLTAGNFNQTQKLVLLK